MHNEHPCSAAELTERRAAFCTFVARARLAPACRRVALLDDAATIARLHQGMTGVPLFADVAHQLSVVGAARCADCGLRPVEVDRCDTGESVQQPCYGARENRTAILPPIELDTAHIAIWLRDEAK